MAANGGDSWEDSENPGPVAPVSSAPKVKAPTGLDITDARVTRQDR